LGKGAKKIKKINKTNKLEPGRCWGLEGSKQSKNHEEKGRKYS
jgi:hypothetical protein